MPHLINQTEHADPGPQRAPHQEIGGMRQEANHFPDVILMDINLPGISGIEALQILREDAATASIPVVALSANAMPRDIEKGLQAGFFRYLTKPIKLKKLMDTLDAAFAFRAVSLPGGRSQPDHPDGIS